MSLKTHMVKMGLGWILLLLAFLSMGSVLASSANVSHSFGSSQSIKVGSLVSLDDDSEDFVELANTENASRLVGVAIASSDSLVALDPDERLVQVATSGNANVLVSTYQGDIKEGDQVAVSVANGIGAKSTPGSYVIGVAQTEFNSSTEGTEEQTITDNEGRQRQVQVGYLNLNIAISFIDRPHGDENLTSLQKLGRSLTGRVISQARLIIATVIAIVSLCAIIALVYSSIYSSVLSIGRNPLAKYAILGTLRTVLFMVGLIVLLSIGLILLLISG